MPFLAPVEIITTLAAFGTHGRLLPNRDHLSASRAPPRRARSGQYGPGLAWSGSAPVSLARVRRAALALFKPFGYFRCGLTKGIFRRLQTCANNGGFRRTWMSLSYTSPRVRARSGTKKEFLSGRSDLRGRPRPPDGDAGAGLWIGLRVRARMEGGGGVSHISMAETQPQLQPRLLAWCLHHTDDFDFRVLRSRLSIGIDLKSVRGCLCSHRAG
jgi:hypothetical protein